MAWEELWLARRQQRGTLAGQAVESAEPLLRDLGIGGDRVKALRVLCYAWDDMLGDPWPAGFGQPDPERCLRIARVAFAASMLADRVQSRAHTHGRDDHVVTLCLRSGALASSATRMARLAQGSYAELGRALAEVCVCLVELEGLGGRWGRSGVCPMKCVWSW